jgi:large subunit ribosomal protein L1
MDKESILKAIKQARQDSKKRKFSQSIDLIITAKDIDLKKTENQKDIFVAMNFAPPKKLKICALVGAEGVDAARDCDKMISQDSFPEYERDEKKVKKLAVEYDFFIAQANIMPAVAKVCGRVLGRRGKMPNPKAGCVVPPKTNLKPLVERLQKSVELKMKTAPMVQCRVGTEDMKDEEIAENILTVFNTLLHALPNERNNIKSVMLKTTMGKPEKINF